MEQVLPIYDCENFDPESFCGDITLLSAEQYIYWVRYQAGQLPDFLRADVDTKKFLGRQTSYMPCIDSILGCSDFYCPTIEWENSIVAKFSELRTILGCCGSRGSTKRDHIVPPMRDQSAWHLFCLGKDINEISCIKNDDNYQSNEESVQHSLEPAPESSNDVSELSNRKILLYEALDNDDYFEENNEEDDINSITNTTTNKLYLDENLKESTLTMNLPQENINNITISTESNTNYGKGIPPLTSLILQFDQVMTQRILAHHAEWLNNTDNLSTLSAMWIYALLARLEKPLCQDTEAIIRGLYRRCCALRATLEETENKLEKEINNNKENSNNFNSMETNVNKNSHPVNEIDLVVTIDSNHDRNEKNENEHLINNNNHSTLASLNIIIVLCGSYFGQGENLIPIEESNNNNNNNILVDDSSNDKEIDDEFGEVGERNDLIGDEGYYYDY